ncbi:MAG: alpha-mannosidase [Phormidesmis sp.]
MFVSDGQLAYADPAPCDTDQALIVVIYFDTGQIPSSLAKELPSVAVQLPPPQILPEAMVSSDSAVTLAPALQTKLDHLRQLNTKDIQSNWHWHHQDIAAADVFQSSTDHPWEIAPLNDRHHIAWDQGLQIRWLTQTITVPTNFYGYPLTGLTLRLALTWWAHDAQIYVDGTLIQSGDLFECFTRICLSQQVNPRDTFHIAIRLVSPKHDNGALVRSQLIYELPNQPTPEPSFIADELTVLATLEPNHQTTIQTALTQLDWSSLNAQPSTEDASELWQTLSSSTEMPAATIHPFQQALSQLRRELRPLSATLQQRTIQCVGHAHLDMAWLWPIADTWKAAERTFQSVLNLQTDFPNLTYTHSSPALFEWIEQNRPELFQQIQKKVVEGSWSIDAGLWIEPELNIIGGEAIIRHILYGQRYCQQKFGSISKIAWLPDSFGFCWQLPQLLVQGGIETFATLKLSWNDTTEFPHQLFWWQSPDGSRILGLMLPPIGTDIDPVKMSTYAASWETNTQQTETLWLPGLGDHGGGPTRDMLEKSQRWEKSPFFPNLTFTTPENYISSLSIPPDQPTTHLPVWNSELYLELHRGCYTTQNKQKQNNRSCEDLLYQAEVFATIAQLLTKQPYPRNALEKAWKTILFNQFHDILPGTSIPEVFVEANKGWEQVKQTGQTVLAHSLRAISSTLQLPTPPHPDVKPLLIFNSLAWPRDAVITLDTSIISPDSVHWEIYNANRTLTPHQVAYEQANAKTPNRSIYFLAEDIPALGYACYWIAPSTTTKDKILKPTNYQLENSFLTVSINSTTGEITSLIEKTTNTEILSNPGNQLQLFRDKSGYWDAWDIASDYENCPLQKPELISVEWQDIGPIRQCIRTIHKTQKSTISQDYILDTHSPFLIIKNNIKWEETHVLLKVNFPLAFSAPNTTYETPFGAITRTTQPTTAAEKAQWEVPALRWADLTKTQTNEPFGVSILTQGKHGFDASPNHLRLSLLKSPVWPDPNTDRGWQQFTYAIYPHAGQWQSAHLPHRARELNIPLITHNPQPASSSNKQNQAKQSFLRIHNPNLILTTLKPTEDSTQHLVLRCYEAYGKPTQINITNSLGLSLTDTNTQRINIVEGSIPTDQPMEIEPWQVASYRLPTQ